MASVSSLTAFLAEEEKFHVILGGLDVEHLVCVQALRFLYVILYHTHRVILEVAANRQGCSHRDLGLKHWETVF